MNHEDLVKRAAQVKTRIQQISPDQAETALQSNEVVILDVREDSEYQKGHLVTAKNLSLNQIAEKIEQIVPDKSTKIVCYCGGGNRSALATDTLNTLGYPNAVSLEGGISEWTSQGKEIVQD